ncbi:MAG: TIGR04283 family arsenosugar biosynthesis glycosyltransferase [Proteobacteria bacterium]|nr:TIGR04283 family arsenosugar biosynthesis glycosyltransferase [Pseudomonadota bacterium]
MGVDISVVIPTWQAGASLGATLGALGEAAGAGLEIEVIVADSGSTDATADLAGRCGARVVSAPRGRGVQLRAGAEAAGGDWLLFLHADTRLASGWAGVAAQFLADPANARRAAAFRFALDDPAPAARRIERLARLRARVLGLVYGDQGLLIRAPFYREIGGFEPIPIMEDVAIVRRVGRHRLTILAAEARTSSVRYREGGYWLRPLRNLLCLALYLLGVPPRLLARLYG